MRVKDKIIPAVGGIYFGLGTYHWIHNFYERISNWLFSDFYGILSAVSGAKIPEPSTFERIYGTAKDIFFCPVQTIGLGGFELLCKIPGFEDFAYSSPFIEPLRAGLVIPSVVAGIGGAGLLYGIQKGIKAIRNRKRDLEERVLR